MNGRSTLGAGWLLLTLLLTGCGGGQGEAADAQPFVAAMHAQSAPGTTSARPTAAAASPIVVDSEALFDWAEWKYPPLFPKGPKTERLSYEGISYLVRAYPNGNYLGWTGEAMYGLGPFTNGLVLRLGGLQDFEAQVRADVCPVYGIDCHVPVITTQPLNTHTVVGQPVTLSVASASPLPQSYRWQSSTDGGRSFADIPGAVAPSYTLPAVTLAENGRLYRAMVDNRDGSMASAAAVLIVRPAVATDYFPLPAGAQWFYRRPDGLAPDEERVVGTQLSAQGQPGTVVESIDGSNRKVSRDLYVAGADGIREYSLDPQDALGQVLDGLPMLRLPVVPGESVVLLDSTVDSGIDVDGDGQTEMVHVVASMSVVGFEAVSTPAAQFNRTLRQSVAVSATFQTRGGKFLSELHTWADVWYADGVGQVKWTQETFTPGSAKTSTFLLEAFQVGALRSDFAPPQVQTTSVNGLIPSLGRRDYVIVFDEPIAAASVSASSLTVTGSQGRTVAGSVKASGTSILFTPQSEWADGDYTVRLAAGVADRLGNAMPEGRSWTFRIDANAPAPASASTGKSATQLATRSATRVPLRTAASPQ